MRLVILVKKTQGEFQIIDYNENDKPVKQLQNLNLTAFFPHVALLTNFLTVYN